MKRTEKRKTVRCAVYTRKSTDEGLDSDFNSLDAQREAGEAFIKSQASEGWVCLGTRYDDGGFTGGNTERPALRRLVHDIEAGEIDAIVVYKVDRLSRSLIDFSKLMDLFERKEVAFISVTQQFNTSTSLGRLTLNMLLSFAQFERELISERTRDKIAAARRKGKWSGGMPVLGYDVRDRKLVINKAEAKRVEAMFELYVEHQSLLEVVREIERRGWKTKRWRTKKKDQWRGGRPFGKNSLYQLLTNPVYVGKVRYKDEVHDGEHDGIVNEGVFNQVQTSLKRNGCKGAPASRNKYGALLRGLLRCAACDCGMAHTYTSKGTKRYRYYTCTRATRQGWANCPSPSIPAGEMEQFVVEQIQAIGQDPVVVAATEAASRQQTEEVTERLSAERVALECQRRADEAELGHVLANGADAERLAEISDRMRKTEARLAEIRTELNELDNSAISEAAIAEALGDFTSLWEVLTPHERARVMELLIQQITYDGEEESVSIVFQPNGIQSLEQVRNELEECAA
ncbi:MAG: recombinase family protein [Pirellulales bacterium]|nr:recombinase family protein [Pirellulales bacterium]